MYKNTHLILISLLMIGLGSLTAQSFVGKLNPYPDSPSNQVSAETNVNVLAVMVQFQVDEDDATFGDGTFGSIYSEDYGDDIIDPLPHDNLYFEDHLMFAKNYFNKVSDGIVEINYTVLPRTFTVSKTMREYSSPSTADDDFTTLGTFSQEVWSIVDEQNPDINFSDYDLFMIFHAGAGRDIDVPGSIGNDRDLPSVYLSTRALKFIYGESFEGYPVDNGSFLISNTAILPETESREISSIGGDVLLELSINGLIVSTIASHLGLPDLFDTETGLSAIGRFGLMDGQAIFAFGGLFPPEPSAWERIYLGWEEPVEITRDQVVNIVSRIVANETDTTLVKIPINSSEYFLVENRKRDANKDGSKVTYKLNGELFTDTFMYDTEKYSFYNIDTLKGVVVDVDEYDWAMPGDDRNTEANSFSDIGLLIWHIDERIINENIEANKINTDKLNRGVELVEADGIPDIGEEFQTLFGDVVGEGSKEDTWYASNPAEFYTNKFNDHTRPSSKANNGAFSQISFSNFSNVSPVMSFDISFGGENVKLLNTIKTQSGNDIKWIDAVTTPSGSEIYVFEEDYYSVFDIQGNFLLDVFSIQRNKPAILEIENIKYVAGVRDSGLHVERIEGIGRPSVIKDADIILTSPPVFQSYDANHVYLLVGTEYGFINTYQVPRTGSLQVKTYKSVKAFDEPVKQIATNGSFVAAISSSAYFDSDENLLEFNSSPIQLSLTENSNGEVVSIIKLEDGTTEVIIDGKIVSEYSSSIGAGNGFSISDAKGDNSNYVFFTENGSITGINILGSTADNFPVVDRYESDFISKPVSVDLDGDELGDIIGFTEDGKVVGISGITGKTLPEFPISFGGELKAVPVLLSDETTKMVLVDDQNNINIWQLSGIPGYVYWSGEFGNSLNQSFVGSAKAINKIDNYFPKSRAYNWPNPVYEGVTFFRYFVSEDSKVEINIFDLAGDYVDNIKDDGVGGFDNEIEWNVTDIESGVYFAHLKTTSKSTGKSDFKIIKVAVIK